MYRVLFVFDAPLIKNRQKRLAAHGSEIVAQHAEAGNVEMYCYSY